MDLGISLLLGCPLSPKANLKNSVSNHRNRRRLVSRLMGMETEYATLIMNHAELRHQDLPASKAIYKAICDAIRRDQPTAEGLFDSDQMFLASGGAVTFESHPSMHALPGGLIEVATPEVHSPSELLACQRSIDSMVEEAARDVDLDVDLRVLKNSSDALGHIYGCQENYETEVASGVWLLVYRLMVCVLWAMQFCTMLILFPLMAMVFALVAVLRLSQTPDAKTDGGPEEMFHVVPSWVGNLIIRVHRIVHFPTVLTLRFVARRVAFRRQRKYLTAFLISRPAICGSGLLDHDGRYWLSVKAMATDSVADMGGFCGERPIFVYGHWLGHYCARSYLSLGSTLRMFCRRQRLQIGLSDSNLSDLSEYVKFGAVSLLLDLIESGRGKELPTIAKPIRCLSKLAGDWHLVTRVPTSQGKLSAIDIQRKYLKAAAALVESTPVNRRGEAPLVIQRWGELLDTVIAYRRNADDIEDAIGNVDWLTKRWLIDQMGDVTWAEKKKIDLRYHELSRDGYYRQLSEAKPGLELIDPDQISRRRRSPPASSPAAKRGWLIREFSGSDESLQAEWTNAMIGRGKNRRRIEFIEPLSE